MPEHFLSAYRIMWLYVMFDLPVDNKADQKRATRFRKHLLDMGFEMAQFSIYIRHCSGKERIETMIKAIKPLVPPKGSVHMLTITDKQFENIVKCGDTDYRPPTEPKPQLTLL